jgi:hypothetical protein
MWVQIPPSPLFFNKIIGCGFTDKAGKRKSHPRHYLFKSPTICGETHFVEKWTYKPLDVGLPVKLAHANPTLATILLSNGCGFPGKASRTSQIPPSPLRI